MTCQTCYSGTPTKRSPTHRALPAFVTPGTIALIDTRVGPALVTQDASPRSAASGVPDGTEGRNAALLERAHDTPGDALIRNADDGVRPRCDEGLV